jgi:hypothetical protein
MYLNLIFPSFSRIIRIWFNIITIKTVEYDSNIGTKEWFRKEATNNTGTEIIAKFMGM